MRAGCFTADPTCVVEFPAPYGRRALPHRSLRLYRAPARIVREAPRDPTAFARGSGARPLIRALNGDRPDETRGQLFRGQGRACGGVPQPQP
eukprot:gene28208-63643_t